MKTKTTQQFIMTLQAVDYAPFLFFLSSAWLEAELEDKWNEANGWIRVSLSIPIDFEPFILAQLWAEWKLNSMDIDYAILN